MERRRHLRKRAFHTQPELTIGLGSESFKARLLDLTEEGFGIETRRPLAVGCRLRLKGELAQGASLRPIEVEGIVRWTVASKSGTFLCGILLDKPGASPATASDPDYYEVLQLSPNADPETVHRVFRVLAQRFHPDNRETGDEGTFKALMRAYEVLSDPAKRASYDAQRPQQQQRRWRIFESSEAAKGIEAERRKRHGALSLLYVRRAAEPRDPFMSLFDLEQMLGCPREHLEFALWFLKENAWIVRGDNGRFAITAKGVEKAEELGQYPMAVDRMIAAPEKPDVVVA
jgi:curved DNA-binding protein